MAKAMIRAEGVGLRYGAGPYVLRDLGFTLGAGAFGWLLGASGAGKTSLLGLLTLAVRPTAGVLHVLDTDVAKPDRRALPGLRQRIGTIHQDFRLLPHLSAFDNVALPLRLSRRPEPRLSADVTEILHWVGLDGRAEAHPGQLSGGERQRVAIARAVIARPALLLADEPAQNLDDGQADRLMTLLAELNRLGTTVLVATRDMALVARHPARALRLAQGRLVVDTPAVAPRAG